MGPRKASDRVKDAAKAAAKVAAPIAKKAAEDDKVQGFFGNLGASIGNAVRRRLGMACPRCEEAMVFVDESPAIKGVIKDVVKDTVDSNIGECTSCGLIINATLFRGASTKPAASAEVLEKPEVVSPEMQLDGLGDNDGVAAISEDAARKKRQRIEAEDLIEAKFHANDQHEAAAQQRAAKLYKQSKPVPERLQHRPDEVIHGPKPLLGHHGAHDPDPKGVVHHTLDVSLAKDLVGSRPPLRKLADRPLPQKVEVVDDFKSALKARMAGVRGGDDNDTDDDDGFGV